MIEALIGIALLTVILIAFASLFLHIYGWVRETLNVRHLPNVTEWQARKNAAPLTHAIMERTLPPNDRGDN